MSNTTPKPDISTAIIQLAVSQAQISKAKCTLQNCLDEHHFRRVKYEEDQFQNIRRVMDDLDFIEKDISLALLDVTDTFCATQTEN